MASTLYVDRGSPVHRLNPVTKLVALVCSMVVVFALPAWWVAALVTVAVVIPTALVGRSGRQLTRVAVPLLLPLILVLALVQGLTFHGGSTVLAQWGPLHLTQEGLRFALTTGSRLVCLVLGSLLFVLTTHPGTLMSALTEKGMSPTVSYIVASTLHLIPTLSDRAHAVSLAQQARGLALSRTPWGRLRSVVPLVGPLVLGLFTDVEERSTALQARGFGAPARRSVLEPVPDSLGQRSARWLMVAAALTALVVPLLLEAW